MSDILTEAQEILKQRSQQYGSADDCFHVIAVYWNTYLQQRYIFDNNTLSDERYKMSAHDVAIMMILMKLARTTTGVKRRDNYIDIAGYAALAEDL